MALPTIPINAITAAITSAPAHAQTIAGAATTAFLRPLTHNDAARFLSQATLGASKVQIVALGLTTYADWLSSQFAVPRTLGHCAWMTAKGYALPTYINSAAGLDSSLWRKFISSPDVLRQRIVLALSEIFVVSVNGLNSAWPQFSVGNYVDLLEANAFGNYRTLLNDIARSPAMGTYLTFMGNRLADPARGSHPDENFARESMQLFTIGLYKLNQDGTPILVNGAPVETYTQEDVTGLARVFTGWNIDSSVFPYLIPTSHQIPMAVQPTSFEPGAKTFLGKTIAASAQTAAACTACLGQALDILFNHPNTAPFFARQMIQRLVTSNPSPAYVARVSAAFTNNGAGVRGDMKAVIRQILLDDEARNPAMASARGFGKLREPVVRFLNWAKGFNAISPTTEWNVGDLSDTVNGLGQSPMHSPSVFNFFRPGYIPPQTSMGTAGLVGAEFQITNETSVASYVNFMQRAVAASGLGDVQTSYATLLPIASDAGALLDEINTVIAAGQISAATLAQMKQALNTIATNSLDGIKNRIHAALVLVLASPEYIVQK
jgi:uncharacterized protein (DUF1800 family)